MIEIFLCLMVPVIIYTYIKESVIGAFAFCLLVYAPCNISMLIIEISIKPILSKSPYQSLLELVCYACMFSLKTFEDMIVHLQSKQHLSSRNSRHAVKENTRFFKCDVLEEFVVEQNKHILDQK